MRVKIKSKELVRTTANDLFNVLFFSIIYIKTNGRVIKRFNIFIRKTHRCEIRRIIGLTEISPIRATVMVLPQSKQRYLTLRRCLDLKVKTIFRRSSLTTFMLKRCFTCRAHTRRRLTCKKQLFSNNMLCYRKRKQFRNKTLLLLFFFLSYYTS